VDSGVATPDESHLAIFGIVDANLQLRMRDLIAFPALSASSSVSYEPFVCRSTCSRERCNTGFFWPNGRRISSSFFGVVIFAMGSVPSQPYPLQESRRFTRLHHAITRGTCSSVAYVAALLEERLIYL
jgi:hypothetical protein